MKELGYFLKTERVENGISLTEASEDLNLSTALLENIESGNNLSYCSHILAQYQ